MPRSVKQKVKRRAARMRRSLVKRLNALKHSGAPIELAELEAALQIATDLDLRQQPEGPLGKMVRELFEVCLDDVRDGTVGLDLEELVIMGRLARRFVLRGRFRQPPA
jgi:hypothetical protein